MTANPGMLYLLFLVPCIVLLHLIRRRRKRLTVSSLLIWDQVAKDSKKIFLSPRLRNIFLLALQVSALLALVFSLAGVSLSLPGKRYNEDILLVLDVSASMKVKTDRGRRIDEARELAEEVIRNLAPGKGMTILAAGRDTKVLTAYTRDRKELRETVAKLAATDEAGDMDKVTELVRSMPGPGGDYRIVIITDTGVSIDTDPFAGRTLEVRRVGRPGDNLAVTAFSSRKPLHRHWDLEFFLEVGSYASSEISAPVYVEFDDGTIKSFDGTFPPGEKTRIIFPFDGFLPTRAKAWIDHKDILDEDNSAYEVIRENRPIRVILVTPGNPALERLLGLFPEVVLFTTKDLYTRTGGADLVIYDRLVPGFLEEGRYIFIGTIPPGFSFYPKGEFREQTVTVIDPDHPLTRYDVFSGLTVHRGTAFSGVDTPLLAAGNLPVVSVYEGEGIKWMRISPDLDATDMTFRPAFPVLVGGGIEWLLDASETPDRIVAGEPVSGVLPLTEVAVRGPDGRVQRLRADTRGIAYPDTSTSGFYSVYQGETERVIAVNPAGGEESDTLILAPDTARGGGPTPGPGAEKTTGLEGLLLLLASLFLCIEFVAAAREWKE